ncbi:hypothetical protein [Breoghania sp. JC706]|uniref:hypothetical protein n=1 Tax=Breoghania sp. JC706 TaxID=3117732 RepID=UPI0030094A4C
MTGLVYDLRTLEHAVSSGDGVLKAREMVPLDEARGIVLAARQHAHDIRRDAEEHHRAERERGYREGRQAAEEDALSRLLAEAAHLDTRLRHLEADLAELVKSCVRKIISTFDDLRLAEEAAAGALRKMRHERQIQIHVAPGLAAAFAPVATRLETLFPEAKTIDLIEDAALIAPNIIVESRIGRIECDLGDQIDRMEAIIDAAVANLATILGAEPPVEGLIAPQADGGNRDGDAP